ncbi:MAG TPA: alpha/beta hydrolase, partial [Phototrophicaceae bacterium]|nr:alpha/beta hydrolase [Phototrophicaceae bacterium]
GTGDNMVLMLHGWGANLDLVLPLAKRLAQLNYRIYAPDLPGFGETAPPPVAWTVYDYAAWVLAYLDSQQISGQVYLFGHSFGGRLSLILGADHAERFRKIVLADSAGVREPAPITSRLRLSTYRAIRTGLRTVGLRPIADHLQSWYSRRYGSSDYNAASGTMRETFVRVVNEDLLPYAARVKPSTLLLWGDRDDDTPLHQGKLLEQTIPDAGLVVFKGAGHYSYLERLDESVRVIDYFFRQPG